MASLGVSVVIPTFNRASLVCRAVESALAAIRPGDEVIVVDDGSTDGTGRALAEYSDRVRYLVSPHAGVGAARNRGVRAARNALLAFLDSDDEWMPDKLELQRTLMERRPEILFCFSDFAHRTLAGLEVHGCLAGWHRDPRSWDEILGAGFPFSSLGPLPPGRECFQVHVGSLYTTQMRGDYVCTSTALVRGSAAGEALRFPEDLDVYEDWEFFARLARVGPAAYLACETSWNCEHDGPRLTRVDDVHDETSRITVLERVWGADGEYLERHGGRYREALTAHRRVRARRLIAVGRTADARAELRLADRASIPERVMARLPGPVARAAAALPRRLRRWLRSQGAGRSLAGPE